MEFRIMAQMNKTMGVIAMAGLLGGLVLAGAPASAQTSAPAAPAPQGGAMMDHGIPNGQGGTMPGMMMNGEMQQKMTRMMDNCNRMMRSMIQNKDGAPAKKG
jgi:Spy/CpxP family protein refolding chaperone